MSTRVNVRNVSAGDDLSLITNLLHAAYACRAAENLKYWATHQTVGDTAERFAMGQGLLAEVDNRIVGTLTVRPPQPASGIALFRAPTTWTLSQFGVLPECRGQGVGKRLHDAALLHARAHGGVTIALDTAAPAEDLIEMYRRWGYQVVGECDWRPRTNYLSVVMARPIEVGE